MLNNRHLFYCTKVLIKCSSCTAAAVATVQTRAPLYFISTKDIVKGKIKSNAPVILFRTVCFTMISFRRIYPEIKLNNLIIAIRIIHIQSQNGIQFPEVFRHQYSVALAHSRRSFHRSLSEKPPIDQNRFRCMNPIVLYKKVILSRSIITHLMF